MKDNNYKLGLNAKPGKIKVLRGKKYFTVRDLKRILDKIDDRAIINFGVIDNYGNTFFEQEDDLIFEIYQDTREDIWANRFDLNILTYLTFN